MSLSQNFKQHATSAQDKQTKAYIAKVEKKCARILQALEKDAARAKKLVDGKGNILTPHGFKGSGHYATGILEYRQQIATCEYMDDEHAKAQLLAKLLHAHDVLAPIHAFCAQPSNDICVEYEVRYKLKTWPSFHYSFDVVVTIKLQEPYAKSTFAHRYPHKPQAVAAPEQAKPNPSPQAPHPIQPAVLDHAHVLDYLKALRNEDARREIVELLGGSMQKPAPRISLDKPQHK